MKKKKILSSSPDIGTTFEFQSKTIYLKNKMLKKKSVIDLIIFCLFRM